jgi:hypothetical protein
MFGGMKAGQESCNQAGLNCDEGIRGDLPSTPESARHAGAGKIRIYTGVMIFSL